MKPKLVTAWFQNVDGKFVHFQDLKDQPMLRETLPLLDQLAFALELEKS